MAAPVTIALTASCSVTPPEKRPRADKADLEAKAVAACECEIAKGKDESPDCWASYEAAIQPFQVGAGGGMVGGGTICVPVSTETDCLKDSGGKFCIVTRYYVKDVEIDEPRLCRLAEARAVEDAVAGVGKRAGPKGNWNEGDWDQKQAKRAVEKALVAVRAGKPLKASRASYGCV